MRHSIVWERKTLEERGSKEKSVELIKSLIYAR